MVFSKFRTRRTPHQATVDLVTVADRSNTSSKLSLAPSKTPSPTKRKGVRGAARRARDNMRSLCSPGVRSAPKMIVTDSPTIQVSDVNIHINDPPSPVWSEMTPQVFAQVSTPVGMWENLRAIAKDCRRGLKEPVCEATNGAERMVEKVTTSAERIVKMVLQVFRMVLQLVAGCLIIATFRWVIPLPQEIQVAVAIFVFVFLWLPSFWLLEQSISDFISSTQHIGSPTRNLADESNARPWPIERSTNSGWEEQQRRLKERQRRSQER